MLEIQDLSIQIAEKNVLSSISLQLPLGRNICLVGKNGSGKSSLALAVMGHPDYVITAGHIVLDGEDITTRSPDRRARA